MMLVKNLVLVLAVGIISSCATKKNADDALDVKLMLDNGYSEGIIISSEKEGDCPFVIEINDENYPYYLDPINLSEEFKTGNQKIWFTFTGARMANRCEKANPISIVDIKKRVE